MKNKSWLNECDADCARANHCHGGIECAGCGHPHCRFELNEDGLCEQCAESAADERYANLMREHEELKKKFDAIKARIAHAAELYDAAYNLLAKLAAIHCDTAESRLLAEVLNKISNEQGKEGETK